MTIHQAELALHQAVDEADHSASPATTTMGRLAPWLAGSGMAMGQAVLATACSLPTLGKCVGCGSCVVGVATLYGWAMKRRKADRTLAEQGLEPFEIRSASQSVDGGAA